jgi:hypothetical protein
MLLYTHTNKEHTMEHLLYFLLGVAIFIAVKLLAKLGA